MEDCIVDDLNEQFVYIYRDKTGIPLYVGRGRQTARSQSHAGERAHNDDLTEALKANPDYSVEISGPFGTVSVSALIEAAVISAINGTPVLSGSLRNKIDGQSAGNFRPLGVPTQFASRTQLPALTKDELHQITDQRAALFVLLKDQTLSDGRPGIDLANPRGIEETQERMVKWWQLKKFMNEWQDCPSSIPCILIGVAGSLKQRIVIGAIAVDDNPALLPWPAKKSEGAAREVPVRQHATLDHCGLRGRRVDPSIVKFGQGASEHFRIV